MLSKFIMLIFIGFSISFNAVPLFNSNSLMQSVYSQPILDNEGINVSNGNSGNQSQVEDNFYNFSSMSEESDGDNEWTRISGIWNFSVDGLQGSTKEDIDTPINIFISPVTLSDLNNISTTFMIQNISDKLPSYEPYVSLVYSFEDAFNYKQSGIIIQNETTFVFGNTVSDNIVTDMVLIPAFNNTQDSFSKVMKMSLSSDNDTQILSLNGTQYPLSLNVDNVDGRVGFAYGEMEGITFTDFEVKGSQSSDAMSQSLNKAAKDSEAGISNITDTQTIILEGVSLPMNDYIPLYDSTPYQILNGHVAAKVPCDEDNATAVDILIGQAPNLAPAKLEFVESLSTPGDLCLFHSDLASDDANTITDIAIENNSTDDIDFPETSGIIITVGSLSK